MNTEAYEAMKLACENFVNKVETGRVRSKNSYEEMKKALLLAKENDVLDIVSKSVEVGDKVKIIANKSSHGFSVGDYCVVNYKNELGDGWEIYANNEIWDLNEDEFTVL